MPQRARPPSLYLPSPISPTTARRKSTLLSEVDVEVATRSSSSSSPPPRAGAGGGHLDAAFRAFDGLVQLAPDSLGLALPNLAVLGEQSAGKSSLLSLLVDVCGASGWADGAPSARSGLRQTRQHCEFWARSPHPPRPLFLLTGSSGPTQIHSRRSGNAFEAHIEIELAPCAAAAAGGATARTQRRRVRFTSVPVTDKRLLKEALKLAGNEARRCDTGQEDAVRTYDELQRQGEEERTADKDWPMLTHNVVKLDISGPDQANLSIVDLPGIVSGDHAELSRADQFITPACEVATAANPDLGRILGVVTKADLIPGRDKQDAAWGKVLSGSNPNFPLRPPHGWHPARLVGQDEYEEDVGRAEFMRRQADLFAEDRWAKHAERCGAAFGWAALSGKIYAEFAAQVAKFEPVLRAEIARREAVVAADLAALPPAVGDPVEWLHGTIGSVAAALEDKMTKSAEGTRALYAPQAALSEALAAAVPEFVPFDKGDELGEYERPAGWPASVHRIYYDDVAAALDEYRNVRVGTTFVQDAQAALVREWQGGWGEVARGAADAMWAAAWDLLDKCIRETVEQKRLQKHMLGVAQAQLRPRRAAAAALADARVADEHAPAHLVEHDRYQPATFAAYAFPAAVEHLRAARQAPAEGGSEADAARELEVVSLGASVVYHLRVGSRRLADGLGAALAREVRAFLLSVPSVLRAGLGLNELSERAGKRVRGWAEQRDVARKRARLADDAERLGQLSALLPDDDFSDSDTPDHDQ
ncbi:hypothetical protein Q8F55_000683 [Vanrija albida]|uniref:GED domain-containing protein n=1 Tax=Vanrija albida TaxID=181172 RepID=A0ABR3QDY9_9TREE